MATDDVEVTLSPADIPGAEISEPFDRHTVSDLCWWLLCRGIKVPTSWRKLSRVNAGEKVAEPGPPPPPLTEWKLVTEDTFQDVALHIPLVTSGKLLYFTLCVLYLFTQVV